MVRPSNGNAPPREDIHLTPWDLRLISVDYIQKGLLLPAPPAGGDRLVSTLESSLAHALGRYYHLAGRLAVEERRDGTVSVRLRCTGEGAELVHATAPGVAVADIVRSVYTPSTVVRALFPLNGVLGADAAVDSLPVLSAQFTELADGVFIAVSLNHSVGDGFVFWEFVNAWSGINRGGRATSDLSDISARVHRSVKELKARANDEMAGTATATISSLQALLAHLWRAVSRARRLPPGQETSYSLAVGCRGRVSGIPPGYMGNALVPGTASCTAGEILGKGLGWTAWQLNRAVASFDEEAVRGWLESWTREPQFRYFGSLMSGGAALMTGSSPRFDVFGNDFGWGGPAAVRSGGASKMDGKATVYEGPERGGSMSLEVCIAPDAMERLVADDEFMDAVTMLPAKHG
ncbi:putative acetyltransferase [Hordeum vulgare]|nr:putative acetyltransferase [Hordeum vulgare]